MRWLALCLGGVLFASAAATLGTTPAEIPRGTPWTQKPFGEGACEDFHFAVLGDRTGGHRPGIFAAAIDALNALRPAFAASIGGLVEGYTEDPEEIAAQWREVDGRLAELEIPFFFTVGNHDYANPVMADYWHRHRGRDFYHFLYCDVLFLFLNTEDPPVPLSAETLTGVRRLEAAMAVDPAGTQRHILERVAAEGEPPLPGEVHIGPRQLTEVRALLARHRNVRWTMVFLHKPAWQYHSPTFAEIEAMLADRDYTVFAGHEHDYALTRRHGRDYLRLGTTGGVWLRNGEGRFDPITWVTMTRRGPRILNLDLVGLRDLAGHPLVEPAISGAAAAE